MVAKYLWEIGSIAIMLLAGTHLYFTFFTDKFSSRNTKLVEDMQSSSPILTNKLTMWSAWIGFNASHSMGGIFIGIINLYLAIRYFSILQSDHFFFIFNILTITFYVWLATKYWFKTPLRGLTITLACYCASYVLTLLVP
jgi:hypothetical protein